MTTATRATARLDAGQIVLAGYSPELVAFYHSLPEARWHRERKAWTCLATPAAAARCVEKGIGLDDNLTTMAAGYIALCNTARPNAVRAAAAGKQPEIRVTEAWGHQREAYWFGKQWGDASG